MLEKSYLKPENWWMIFVHDLYTMFVMGMGEKPRNKRKNKEKKSPFGTLFAIAPWGLGS